LIAELPAFVAFRSSYLDPCLESLVKTQIKFAKDSFDRLNSIQRYFPDNSIDNVLSEMKQLSIVG
jgi:hypothetical protein